MLGPVDVTCPNCGQANPEGFRFCGRCGRPLEATQPAGAEERKVVTVLFADVAGSTSLGERLDPERLKDVMGSFFAAMREEIEAEGGTVEKFIGDAVMAAFGVPAAHEDDPARALRAALRMRDRLEELNVELQATHGVGLAIRVGVNTGEVMAVTAPRPGEAMVAGDAVNVAARLEQVAVPGSVVVAERTARATRGFSFRRIGPLELKGKERGVRALELVAEQRAAPARGIPGLAAPMIGRDEELSLLRSIYHRSAAEGRPHLVTVLGDAGIGKSRLVAEFVAAIESSQDPPLILRGRCLPYGEGITYWPLAEVLKGHAGVLDTDPPEMAVEKVRKVGADLFTPGLATDPARATAALAYTIGVEDPDVDIGSMPPRQVRSEVHAAWRSFFSALAAAGPIVVVVEDIHWADGALLDLLEEMADRVEGPAVFVCPSRPELLATRPGWGGGRRSYSSVFLDPLSERDAQGLVTTLLTIDDLPRAVRDRILERAEGNPFYLEEIVRGLIDAGRVVREDGRWRASEDIGEVEIPDTVQGVLAARIDLLAPGDKLVLQCAAVVGRVFWSEPVARLLAPEGDAAPGASARAAATADPPDDPSELSDAFDRLQERELILARLGSTMAGQQEFIFKHILTRDVAYGSLPRRDRVRAHAEVASWIETTAGERRDEFIELLAYHYGEAHRGIRDDVRADPAIVERLRRAALDAFLRSSGVALTTMAVRPALRAAEQADALAVGAEERATTLEAVGAAYSADYRGDEAWRSLRQAADIRSSDLPGDGPALARVCAYALEVPTRWPGSMHRRAREADAERYLAMGLEACPPGDGMERTRLLLAEAFWSFAFREARDPTTLERSAAAGDEAIAMAQRLGRVDLELAALDARGSVPMIQGICRGVWPLIARRLELLRDTDDPWEVGDAYAIASWHLFDVGRYVDAVRYGIEGAEQAVGGMPGVGVHCLARGLIAMLPVGRWDDLLGRFAELLESLGDRRDEPPSFGAWAYMAAAYVHEARGERESADRLLRIVDDLRDLRGEDTMPLADAFAAALMARRERFDDAFRRLEVHRTDRSTRAAGYAVLCDLIADAGRWDEAEGFADTARAWAEHAGLEALPAHAERLRGRAALAAGRPADAVDLLTRARDTFERLGAAWEVARTELFLGPALRAAGSDADGVLRAAFDVFERVGALREAASARDLLDRR
jgi:class 3 adenylate cyclase